MIEIACIAGQEAFNRLAEEWDALAGRAMSATPFQTLAYQRSWWTNLGPGDLFTLTARDRSGTLSGIGCFYLLDGTLYFNGCTEETDYLDLICHADQAQEIWAAVVEFMDGPNFPDWSAMDLCNIPAASPTRRILPELADRYGWTGQEAIHEVCPIISLPETFDAYLDALDKKQRHEVRRKLRRAKGAGVSLQIVQPDEDVAAAIDRFLELLQMSSPEKEAWLDTGRRNLFHEVAAAAQANGSLQLLFLMVGDRPAAALFNFDYQNRIWVYNSGMDMENFAHLSPGVVLTAQAIERAIATDRDSFDFLRGNETYKYRFGAQDTQIYRLQIQRD